MNNQVKVGIVIVALIIVAGIGIAARRVIPASPGGGTNQQVSIASSTAPSFTAPVVYSNTLPADAKQILVAKISDLRAQLAKDNSNYNAWLDLALRYKQAEDFDKTRAVWEYLADLHLDDAVSRHNLGDLYENFLHDNVKAERYYKDAINAGPTQAINYIALGDFYRNHGNTKAAEQTLKLGLQGVSGDQALNLDIALASYYQTSGDKANAITYYTKAKQAALKAGNTQLAAELEKAIAGLR